MRPTRGARPTSAAVRAGAAVAVVVAVCSCSGPTDPVTTTPGAAPTSVIPGAVPVPAPGGVASCPPGTDPDLAGPVTQARPRPASPAWVGDLPAVVIPRLGVVLALDTRSATTWGLDLCTNTWRLMHPRREPTLLESREVRLVYAEHLDQVVALSGAVDQWVYSVAENTWSLLSGSAWAQPVDGWRYWPDLVYDPARERIIARDSTWGGQLWSYDPAEVVWTEVPVRGRSPRDLELPGSAEVASAMAYDPSVDGYVLAVVPVWADSGVAAATWVFDPGSRRWRRRAAEPPPLAFTWIGTVVDVPVVYDEAAGRTVLMSPLGGTPLALYDAVADRWEARDGEPGWAATGGEREGYQLLYDPVNERLVVLGGLEGRETDEYGPASSVWAYDVGADEWTLLVPPDGGRR